MEIFDSDIRLFRVFRAVVKCGGFTTAEVELNKSKSAISTDISHLEGRLGVRLCNRGRSGFSLTREGQMIFSATVDLFSDLDRFRNHLNLATATLAGEIKISMDDSFLFSSGELIRSSISAFSSRHPQVFIDLQSASARSVEKTILDGSVDLGITTASKAVQSLVLTEIFDEELNLYCGAGHPLTERAGKRIPLGELTAYPMIDLTARSNADLVEFIGKFSIHARADDSLARVALILSGRFLGFLPRDVARPWVDEGKLLAINPKSLSYSNKAFCAWRKDAPANSIRDAFKNVLLGFT
nr:LysR family transcriptional regulator [uncultured Roseovarius sp.]